MAQKLKSRDVVVDEDELFQALVAKWTPLSSEIRRIEYELSEASDGSPAAWISVVVPEDYNPPRAKIDEFLRVTNAIQNDVFGADTRRWPYVNIVTE